jgi:hypothetical protein
MDGSDRIDRSIVFSKLMSQNQAIVFLELTSQANFKMDGWLGSNRLIFFTEPNIGMDGWF